VYCGKAVGTGVGVGVKVGAGVRARVGVGVGVLARAQPIRETSARGEGPPWCTLATTR
jgi:hypothetical protein